MRHDKPLKKLEDQELKMANNTREIIFKVAQSVFEEKGYRRATIREICRRAEVNIASIKYYYGGKHELFAAVMEQYFSHIFPAAEFPLLTIVDQQSMVAALQEWIDDFVRRLFLLRAKSAGLRIFTCEFLEKSEVCPELYERYLRRDIEQLATILRYGLADQEIDDRVYAILGECLFFVNYGEIALLRSEMNDISGEYESKIVQLISKNATQNLTFRNPVE